MAAISVALVAGACSAAAQRLPFTTYTAAHGLAGEFVSTAIEDAHGFLWVGTDRGLSRFDGMAFRTFDRREGLAHDNVTSIVVTRDGTIWVGTWGAAYRFDGHTFTEILVEGKRNPWERVMLAVDRQDRVWCVADGVYRLDDAATSRPVLRPFAQLAPDAFDHVDAVFADREGNVWVGGDGLFRVSASGEVNRVEATPPKAARVGIVWLAETPTGRIAAATVEGVEYVDACDRSSPSLCLFSWIPELATTRPYRIISKSDGGLWIGRTDGLIETDAAGRFLRRISKQQGLVPSPCWPLLVDRSGDLWVGSDSGIQRLAGAGFAVFGPSEGLEATQVASIFGTRAGEVVVDATPQVLQRFDTGRFIPTRPRLPRGFDASWGWYQLDLQDHTGQWWIPTARGLVRFPAADRPDQLARARPIAVYASPGCFRGREIFRLYEDTHGDLWISTIEHGRDALYRWNRSSDTFDCFDPRSIVGEKLSATAFLDDGRGTIWIGFGHGQLARYRGGRFECVMDCGTGTHGLIHALLMDDRRRLWIATARAGLFRVDRPDEARITAVPLTIKEGLSSNVVRAVATDRFGRTYIGTDRGVDVLDGEASPLRHLGPEEGLPHPHVTSAWTDPGGDVWFGTLNGVARFTPPARFSNLGDVSVLLDGVRVSGVALPFTAMGQDRLDHLVLAPDQRDIAIDLIGLPRAAAATLQFQYRRSPAEQWSVASPTRTLILAGLSSGSYRYEIRAIAPTGVSSSNAVIVGFRVLAPIYGRPWFVVLSAAAALALAFTFYRARLARAVALERQRAQIAMDLHDEMGSRLGSIGLLADVAAERCRGESGGPARLLGQIGEVASEMGSSLTDIVLSLREEEMTVESLARHLAERGRHLFPDPACVFDVHFPAEWPQARMSRGARRNAFLIGLEALHNAARHSQATRVVLRLQPLGRQWRLTVVDDGTGMDIAEPNGTRASGFGLDGMKRRSSMIDATLDIQSQGGAGTTVSLVFNPRAESREHSYDHSTERARRSR